VGNLSGDQDVLRVGLQVVIRYVSEIDPSSTRLNCSGDPLQITNHEDNHVVF
jgi:hypothetical protein